MAFKIPARSSSYVDIYEAALDFLNSKSDYEKYKDYYTSSMGTTMLELNAGFSEFRNYNARLARRETYLCDAKLVSSVIGIAQSLGYSAYRGKNIHLQITFVPSITTVVNAYTVIGSYLEYDIVSLETKAITLGIETSLNIALGSLMEESVTIASNKTYMFRFTEPEVSEDVQVLINNEVVPTSRNISDLNNDKFIVMSNAMESIDIWYLNIYPPASWISEFRYSFDNYVVPNFDWKASHVYEEGDVCVSISDRTTFYQCIGRGISGSTEPIWSPYKGDTTEDGTVVWKSLGVLGNIFYRCVTAGVGFSGSSEPNWKISLNEETSAVNPVHVEDGDLVWECTDVYDYSKYPYETGDTITIRYVQLVDLEFNQSSLSLIIGDIASVALLSKYYEPESIDSIKVNAPVYHETKQIIKGRNDYKKLFWMITSGLVDTNARDVTPAVVELTYIRNHTYKCWLPDTTYQQGDYVLSEVPNGYTYTATNTGTSSLSTRGKSGSSEPAFENHQEIGEVWKDNQVWWKTEILVLDPSNWKANTMYYKGDIVKPTYVLPTSVQYKAVQFDYSLTWPTTLGESIQDNEIVWECVDNIYLKGYTAEVVRPKTAYSEGDFVYPVVTNGYFYKCVTAGITDEVITKEWSTELCATVLCGTVVFECYDKTDSEVYVKNNILNQLDTYRPFGVEPPTMTDPELVYVILDIQVTLNTIKDEVTVRNDIKELLHTYEQQLGLDVSNSNIENLIEQNLDYIRIARVNSSNETKTETWTPGTEYVVGDTCKPTEENGYRYRVARIIDSDVGYSQWEDRGMSNNKEPTWNTEVNSLTEDRNLIWKCFTLGTSMPSLTWTKNTVYRVGQIVLPTVSNGRYYKLVQLKYVEPDWPETPGVSILDNNIYWVCYNPIETLVPISWKQYYIFGQTLTLME